LSHPGAVVGRNWNKSQFDVFAAVAANWNMIQFAVSVVNRKDAPLSLPRYQAAG
jgi:hypothetical protein